jgi:homoserine O-acetyltransferase
VGRDRGGIEKALKCIKAKALVIGIETDMLFPLEEQKKLAKYIPGAAYRSIHSAYGHDGFLLEYEQIEQCITTFLLPEKSRGSKLAIRN